MSPPVKLSLFNTLPVDSDSLFSCSYPVISDHVRRCKGNVSVEAVAVTLEPEFSDCAALLVIQNDIRVKKRFGYAGF